MSLADDRRRLNTPVDHGRGGLTLLELLLVMTILGVLVAILLPAAQASREAARRAQCANHQRQLAIAAQLHVSAQGNFPPGIEQWYFNSAVSHRGISLFAYLLPYWEQANVLVRWDYDNPIHNANQGPQSNTARVLPMLLCPTDAIAENPVRDSRRDWHYGLTSYGGNGGTRSYFPATSTADGIFHTTGEASEPERYQRAVRPRDVLDGLSHTLLFGERAHHDPNYLTFNHAGWGEPLQQWGWWGASTSRKMIGHVTMSGFAPLNYRLPFSHQDRHGRTPPADTLDQFQHYVDLRVSSYGSLHPGGANFAFADGSVSFISDDAPRELMVEVSTRAGRE